MATSAFQIPWRSLVKSTDKTSDITGNKHSASDILRAALQGQLTLSVQLCAPVTAKPGWFQDSLDGRSGKDFTYSVDDKGSLQGLLDLVLVDGGKMHVENLARNLAQKKRVNRKQHSCRVDLFTLKHLRDPFGNFKKNGSMKIGVLYCGLRS